MEEADGVRPAADAGDDGVRQGAVALQILPPRLVADHALQLAHHVGVGVRPGRSADDVVSVGDVGHPIAHRLVQRVLQGAGAAGDGHDLGAHQPHAKDVELLPLGVLDAHIDDALQAELGADGGGGHSVLPGAGLGNDSLFAHPPGQQALAEGVVDLVGAGVVQVLALQGHLQPAGLAQAGRFGERGRPAHIVMEQRSELRPKLRLAPGLDELRLQLIESRDEGFGDISSAELAKSRRSPRNRGHEGFSLAAAEGQRLFCLGAQAQKCPPQRMKIGAGYGLQRVMMARGPVLLW